VQYWDVGSQKRTGGNTKFYYEQTQITFICFDVTNFSSFEYCETLREDTNSLMNAKVPMFLIGIPPNGYEGGCEFMEKVESLVRMRSQYVHYAFVDPFMGSGVSDLERKVVEVIVNYENVLNKIN